MWPFGGPNCCRTKARSSPTMIFAVAGGEKRTAQKIPATRKIEDEAFMRRYITTRDRGTATWNGRNEVGGGRMLGQKKNAQRCTLKGIPPPPPKKRHEPGGSCPFFAKNSANRFRPFRRSSFRWKAGLRKPGRGGRPSLPRPFSGRPADRRASLRRLRHRFSGNHRSSSSCGPRSDG